MIIRFKFRKKNLKFSLLRHSDFSAFYQVFVENSYSHLLNAIVPGDIVLDAGANIGIFTILASVLVGKKGSVISIEPEPVNLESLRRNIELNELTNVTIVERALYNTSDTEVDFEISSVALKMKNEVPNNKELFIKVKTITLDDLLNQLKLKPTVLKMDIEGAEIYALQKAAKTLESLKLLEAEIHNQTSERKIREFSNFDFFVSKMENIRTVRKFTLKHPIKVLILEWHNHFKTSKRVFLESPSKHSDYPIIIFAKRKESR